jgi:hypothetical protein
LKPKSIVWTLLALVASVTDPGVLLGTRLAGVVAVTVYTPATRLVNW